MRRLICFGSLRRDSSRGYNFGRFGANSQRYIKDVILKGFDLYDLGAYPATCVGAGVLKAELHEVDDDAFAAIRRMEIGAGYSESTVQIDGEAATIYVMSPERLSRYPKIESGDWS